MNGKIIIQALIFVLVVSVACAGIYAHPGDDLAHDDSSGSANGIYISGSSDVCHVAGLNVPNHTHNINSTYPVICGNTIL